eukprot:TRINITY_DN9679_c0_g1_i1.p1 TRINITY_DN9679_c0_g1~~TRINITY_DN9679_c0_g1_i1.p1  ORF type:complete len:189 (+),score=33.00 TRINITY_DN9679_c0_g1_i1:113-679(+)
MDDFSGSHCTISDDETTIAKPATKLRVRSSSGPSERFLLHDTKQNQSNDTCLKELEENVPLDAGDFECSLCFRLFCKPITTPCGHTYCKNCILSSLKYSPMCPLCRTELGSGGKFKTNCNIVLINILEKHFKEQYSQRQEEDEKEEKENVANEIENDKDEPEETFYTTWTSCLLPSVRETCCVLLSCT